MRKRKKVFILQIALGVFIVSMSISIGFLYLDTTSGTNLLSKYGIFTGIPSAISGLMFVWFIVKIMSGKKVD